MPNKTSDEHKIRELNELIDKAINDVLQDTNDRFEVPRNEKEPDYESFKDSDPHKVFEDIIGMPIDENQFKGTPGNKYYMRVTNPEFEKAANRNKDSFETPPDHQVLEYSSGPIHFDNNKNNYKENTTSPGYQQTYEDDRKQRDIDKAGNNNNINSTYRQPINNNERGPTPKVKPTAEPGKGTDPLQGHGVKAQDVYCPDIIKRSVWGALPPMGTIEPMKHPVESIVFSTNTQTRWCEDPKSCKRTVREIQARHMGEGLADIQYNFLVGGDGQLYEGRGWNLESGVKKSLRDGPNVNIAFIGKFVDEKDIPDNMIQPVQDLLIYGNAQKYIKGAKAVKEVKTPS